MTRGIWKLVVVGSVDGPDDGTSFSFDYQSVCPIGGVVRLMLMVVVQGAIGLSMFQGGTQTVTAAKHSCYFPEQLTVAS